ncbi:AraC family transcriptional regulator [Mesorhizobium sp.]|uniref:AraC family transcriptional regulator n=1 Tax=Mesorhizobium sp. TaxID=1871066 RepID=UPI000FE941DF|nr:AraC family transcriptional regulator [Mesorhizobium sp.]RWM09830.1 MAG: AraC family transcriptional regulator [Mesorhizobium sp.]
MAEVDWLSHLFQIITVTGQLEVRCAYGAPWRIAWSRAAANEIPYHIIVKGRAILDDPESKTARELVSGDIVLLPHGAPHVLHDGSGQTPVRTHESMSSAGWMLSKNDSQCEQLDLLCGRFFVASPHDRLIRNYLPTTLVAGSMEGHAEEAIESAFHQLASLVGLMRMESAGDRAGGRAILNALSSALFAFVLRAASQSGKAPEGLLALAGHPRLAPAMAAMLANPTRPWKLPELAALCGMSRATFMRQFQDKLGRSALDFVTDLRMSLAANELRKPVISTEAVAEIVGYRSVSAFRHVFTERMGMTPGEWRRLAHKAD